MTQLFWLDGARGQRKCRWPRLVNHRRTTSWPGPCRPRSHLLHPPPASSTLQLLHAMTTSGPAPVPASHRAPCSLSLSLSLSFFLPSPPAGVNSLLSGHRLAPELILVISASRLCVCLRVLTGLFGLVVHSARSSLCTRVVCVPLILLALQHPRPQAAVWDQSAEESYWLPTRQRGLFWVHAEGAGGDSTISPPNRRRKKNIEYLICTFSNKRPSTRCCHLSTCWFEKHERVKRVTCVS